MLEIGVAEAQQQIAALMKRVQEGEQVIVTHEGRWSDPDTDRVRTGGLTTRGRGGSADRGSLEDSAGDFSWETMKRYRNFGRR